MHYRSSVPRCTSAPHSVLCGQDLIRGLEPSASSPCDSILCDLLRLLVLLLLLFVFFLIISKHIIVVVHVYNCCHSFDRVFLIFLIINDIVVTKSIINVLFF